MKWKNALCGSASIVALTLLSGAAVAQSDQAMETVVVTGTVVRSQCATHDDCFGELGPRPALGF